MEVRMELEVKGVGEVVMEIFEVKLNFSVAGQIMWSVVAMEAETDAEAEL